MKALAIIQPAKARPHPQPAGCNPRPGMTASALSHGRVVLMQFEPGGRAPKLSTVLTPAGAQALAQQLLAAVAVAQEVRGAA